MEIEDIFLFQNLTGTTGGDFVVDFPELAISLIVLLIIGSVFGTVGNVLIIFSIFTSKELNTNANLFVVSLACADITIASFVGPLNVVGIVEGADFFKPVYGLCIAIASICLTSCLCSLLGLMMIGINRYIYICKHSYYRRIYSRRNTLMMVAGTWIVAFFVQLPNFFGWGGHIFDQKTKSCIWDRMADQSFTLFFVFGLIGIPACITAVSYMKIYLFYRASLQRIKQWNQNGQSSVTNRNNIRLAKTLFIIYFVFIMCWTPYACVTALDTKDEYSVVVHGLAVFLAHLNSSLNSILYGMTNPQFRMAYYRLIRSIYRKLRRLCCFRNNSIGNDFNLTTTANEPDQTNNLESTM